MNDQRAETGDPEDYSQWLVLSRQKSPFAQLCYRMYQSYHSFHLLLLPL